MDQSLLAAPHGFSQRATSFIASWRQGIHRMPLLRSTAPSPSQPAKARSRHAQEPSMPSRPQAGQHHAKPASSRPTSCQAGLSRPTSCQAGLSRPTHDPTHHGAQSQTHAISTQQHSNAPERSTRQRTACAAIIAEDWTMRSRAPIPVRQPPPAIAPRDATRTIFTGAKSLLPDRKTQSIQTGSNPCPSAMKTSPNRAANPSIDGSRDESLAGSRGSAPGLALLAKTQASGGARWWRRTLVETIGIEPTTPCLQSRCSPS